MNNYNTFIDQINITDRNLIFNCIIFDLISLVNYELGILMILWSADVDVIWWIVLYDSNGVVLRRVN